LADNSQADSITLLKRKQIQIDGPVVLEKLR